MMREAGFQAAVIEWAELPGVAGVPHARLTPLAARLPRSYDGSQAAS